MIKNAVRKVEGLSPLRRKLLETLGDGKPHAIKELLAMVDDKCTIDNLRCHMSNIRTYLRTLGDQTVVCEGGCYRKAVYQ